MPPTYQLNFETEQLVVIFIFLNFLTNSLFIFIFWVVWSRNYSNSSMKSIVGSGKYLPLSCFNKILMLYTIEGSYSIALSKYSSNTFSFNCWTSWVKESPDSPMLDTIEERGDFHIKLIVWLHLSFFKSSRRSFLFIDFISSGLRE